ncbi:MAG: caspase family protein [Candidatus Competibacteraceae bacterium]|nr:caspase family protein [Candidatus Competibacteraceae bacterium]
MKYISLINILLAVSYFTPIYAQQTKGADVVGSANKQGSGQVYALIVGLSQYQFPDTYIPLQFADRDARVFYSYLRSEAGGLVPADHIDTLFNQNATYGEVMSKLLSIKDRMKENDLLYFYFSGHGDAYNASKAFLLPYDAPAGKGKSDKNHYLIGTTVLDLHTIKVIFLELTSNKRNVVFISDACRTHELSGGDDGRSHVFKKIMEEDAGEIRFSSCSSNQVSFEGPQWGGGRGLFSWHLVNGLMGMADTEPEDGKVTVDELYAYVKSQVKNASYDKQSETHRQTPQFSCKADNCESFVLARVNTKEKERLALELKQGSNTFYQEALAMHSPGKGVDLPAEMQKIGQKHLYDEFSNRLLNNQYIGPNSAFETYQKIAENKNIPKQLVNEFKGILSSRLITDVNKIINTYLNAAQNNNLYTYDYFYNGYLKLKHFIQIADPLFYNAIDAKVNLLFLEAHANWRSKKSKEVLYCLSKVDSAVALKPDAAFLYNLKGILHQRLKQFKESEAALRKGIALAPGWLYPTHNLGLNFSFLNMRDSSFHYYFKALSLDTNYQTTYSVIASEHAILGNNDSSVYYLQKGLEKDPTDPYLLYQMGYHYYQQKNWNKALMLFRQSFTYDPALIYGYEGAMLVHLKNYVSIDSVLYYKDLLIHQDPKNPEAYYDLGSIMAEFEWDSLALGFYNQAIYYDSLNTDYWNAKAGCLFKLGNKNMAIGTYKKSIQIDSTNSSTYNALGILFFQMNRTHDAIREFQLAIRHNPLNHIFYYNVGYMYQYIQDYENAELYYIKAIEINSIYADTHYSLAQIYALSGKSDKALISLEKALKLTSYIRSDIENDSAFKSMLYLSSFQSLLRKYLDQ